MEHLKKIKKKALEDLEEFGQKKELNLGDYTTIHMLTDTIKNIDKICMLEEEGGYSQAVDMDRRMMPHYNQGGHSYADGGNGSNGTYSQRRDSMGRYSKAAEDKNRIIKDIEKMTDKFTDAEWDVMEDFVRRIREAS